MCRSLRRAPPYPPHRAAARPLSMSTRERARRAAKGALRLELRAVQHLHVCRSRRPAPPPPPRRAAALPLSMSTRERARRAAKGALRLELRAMQHRKVCSSSRGGTLRRTVPRSWRERRHKRASRGSSSPRARARRRCSPAWYCHHQHARTAAAPPQARRAAELVRLYTLRRDVPRHDDAPGWPLLVRALQTKKRSATLQAR
jgi:hypothetical protein